MNGKLIQNKYRVLEILGQNAFSETFLATDCQKWSARRYVIKKLRPILGNPDIKDIRHLFYQEASILKRLSGNHPQIPRLYEYFTEGEDFYLVREWIGGLTLKQKVEQQGNLTAPEVEEILDSILSFLKYIHSYGIVYRQLKPSTIILRENRWSNTMQKKFLPVPIYFGGVKELEATIDNSKQYVAVANQQEYIPPEQKQGKPVFASDLYSLGMTAIYLLTGKNPAEFPIDSRTKQLLWHQEIPNLNVHLVRAIDRAICPNTDRRFTSAEEMLDSLHSPSITLSMPVEKREPKQLVNSDFRIITFLCSMGIGVLGLTFAILNFDLARFKNDNTDKLARDYQTEVLLTDSLTLPETPSSESVSATKKIPSFPLGLTQPDIIDLLGEPNMNSRGYWQDSRALMYQDIVPEQIVLGYLTDIETKAVRQAELAFTNSVDLPTIKLQAQNLLQDNYSLEIEHYINQVYFQTSDRHEFEIDNIRGVVQRNPPGIYLSRYLG